MFKAQARALPRASYRRGGGRRQETTQNRFAPDVADI